MLKDPPSFAQLVDKLLTCQSHYLHVSVDEPVRFEVIVIFSKRIDQLLGDLLPRDKESTASHESAVRAKYTLTDSKSFDRNELTLSHPRKKKNCRNV